MIWNSDSNEVVPFFLFQLNIQKRKIFLLCALLMLLPAICQKGKSQALSFNGVREKFVGGAEHNLPE